MRFLNAVAELNRAGSDRLTTIALYTEPDRHAWFVREADEAVCIGPATTFDEQAGREAQTYLDHDRLERALVAPAPRPPGQAEGFVAEQAEFVDLCDKLGIVFIGPSATPCGGSATRSGPSGWPRRPGSPSSRGAAARSPTSTGRRRTHRLPAARQGHRRGRRRGIRRVTNPAELAGAFEAARAEARSPSATRRCSSNARSRNARHVEVQVIADHHGACGRSASATARSSAATRR